MCSVDVQAQISYMTHFFFGGGFVLFCLFFRFCFVFS